MLSIGEFSRATGLTLKAIRFYDEKGLLPPAAVDPSTGYRSYDAASIDRARVIVALRGLDFTVEDCCEILRTCQRDEELVGFLERHKRNIAARRARCREIERALEEIIRSEKEAAMAEKELTFEVRQIEIPPFQVAGIRAQGRYQETGRRIGQVARAAGRKIRGKPLNVYYDAESKEEADYETAFPVGDMTAKGPVSVHTLPGGLCVSLVHQGSYETIGRSYEKVFSYLRDHGLRPLTPSYEIYVKGPGMIFRGNPRKYLTEIQVRVERPGGQS